MNHSPKVEVARLGEDPSSSVIGEAITGSPKKEVTGLQNHPLASVFGEETGGRRRRRSGFQSSTIAPQVLGFLESAEKTLGVIGNIPRGQRRPTASSLTGSKDGVVSFSRLVLLMARGVCSPECSRLVLFGVSCVVARFLLIVVIL